MLEIASYFVKPEDNIACFFLTDVDIVFFLNHMIV